MPQFRTPQGDVVTVPDDQASSAEAAGYEPVSVEQAGAVTAARESPDRGALGTLNAGLTAGLSGATLGLSDYALKGLLNKGQLERLASEREEHPVASGIGQVVGSVAPALVAPESLLGRAPAGVLSRSVAPLLERGVGGVLAAGAIEGAGQNAGAYLADTALGDRQLSAEGLFGALGEGAAFGTAGGAAALGIEKGTMAARRMFSRVAGTDKAALEAEQAWKAAHQSTVEANDAAADIAKAKLAQAKAAREQAGLAKQQAGLRVAETEQAAPELDAAYQRASVERDQVRDAAKAAYEAQPTVAPVAPAAPTLTPEMHEGLRGLGLSDADIAAAPPDQLAEALRMVSEADAMAKSGTLAGAPTLSPAAEQRLTEAVIEHDAAKADLDDILRRIETPDLQWSEPPRGYAVPPAEWGPPGMRGYDPGNIPAPGQPSLLEAGTGDATAIGKRKLAEGTPAAVAPEQPSALEGLVGMQREAGQMTNAGAVPGGSIDRMSLDEIEKLQADLNAGFGKVPSGSREYVDMSRRWDEAVARRRELETGKATVRVPSDAHIAAPLDENEFESFAKEWQSGLPAGASEAMQTYTANGAYSHINGPLRLGEGLSGIRSNSLRDAVPVLDDAVASAPAPRDMVAFRGVTGRRSTKEWNDVGVGDTIVDRGFGSTSTMPHVGASYATGLGARPGVELRISIPKGYPAAPVPSEIFGAERELLLPRNTKYTVTKVVPHDNGRVVFVTASPAVEGEASSVAAVARRDAKTIDQLTLTELEDREASLRDHRDSIRRRSGSTSEEYKAANAEFERAYQRRQDIKSGKVPEPTEMASAEPPADSLLGALQGTSAKLNEGAELGAISAESPARADYVVAKRAKQAEDAAFFRARAKGETPEADAFFANLTRPKTRDAYVAQNIGRAMREEGSHAEALAKVEREWAETGGQSAGSRSGSAARGIEESPAAATPMTWREFTASKMSEYMKSEGGHAGAMKRLSKEWRAAKGGLVENLEGDLKSATARAESATTAAERDTAEQEVHSIEEHLSRVGAIPSAVDDVAAVAHAVTNYERSAAKLVDELGPEAPPAAQEAAKAFRAAEEHADRKVMDRTTRAIDDGVDSQGRPRTVEHFGRKESEARIAEGQRAAEARAASSGRPTWEQLEEKYGKYAGQPELPRTSKQAIEAAKADRAGADVVYRRAKVGESEAKIAYRGAADRAAASREAMAKAAPGPGAAGPQSLLGSVATAAATGAEIFDIPGIPKPHDIPVIGPLLGMYLKYKAFKAATGRFVGRVAANGDTRAAALVARTKDKVAKAVDRTLGLVAETAPKARPVIVASSAALGHRVFDDGEPDAKRDATPRELAAVRIREIATAAARPELVQQYVRKELRGVVDPDLLAAAEQHMIGRFQYLASVMPKAPPPNPYSKREWMPSAADTSTLAQRLEVVHNPIAAFDNPTPAKIDTLRNVSPKLLELAQQRLVERISDATKPVAYKERLKASSLYGIPLDDSLDPQSIQVVQAQYALSRPAPAPQPAAPPASSVAADVNLTQMYQTASDRRATMR